MKIKTIWTLGKGEEIFLQCDYCDKWFDEDMLTEHLNKLCYANCQRCDERLEREEIRSHVCTKPMTEEERKRAERDRRHRALVQDFLTPERLPPSTGYSKPIQQAGNIERNRRKH